MTNANDAPPLGTTTLRVWSMRNMTKYSKHPVDSPQKGLALINRMAQQDLQNPFVDCNAFGLEVFEDGEWCEWEDEDGHQIDDYEIVGGEFKVVEDAIA